MTDPTRDDVYAAAERLRSAGLYAKGSDPVDWGNARRSGRQPVFIRGGTYTEDAGGISVINNSFFVEGCDEQNDYLVRFPAHGQLIEEKHFAELAGAVDFVIAHWSPSPEQVREILRCTRDIGLTPGHEAALELLLVEGVDAASRVMGNALPATIRRIVQRISSSSEIDDRELGWRVRLACEFAQHCKRP